MTFYCAIIIYFEEIVVGKEKYDFIACSFLRWSYMISNKRELGIPQNILLGEITRFDTVFVLHAHYTIASLLYKYF